MKLWEGEIFGLKTFETHTFTSDDSILAAPYAISKLLELERDIKKLRECVEFYADKDNYELDCRGYINDRVFNDLTGDGCGSFTDGKRARKTLKEIDENN